MSEQMWMERAQSCEARLHTAEDQFKPALERVKEFKSNFGVRESDDGTIIIDYDKFVERLGIEGALELRAIIDSRYQISGSAGEKPRVKLSA